MVENLFLLENCAMHTNAQFFLFAIAICRAPYGISGISGMESSCNAILSKT